MSTSNFFLFSYVPTIYLFIWSSVISIQFFFFLILCMHLFSSLFFKVLQWWVSPFVGAKILCRCRWAILGDLGAVSWVQDVDEQTPNQPLTWRSEHAIAKILYELNVCSISTNCINFVCFRYHTHSYREDLRFEKRAGICPRGGRWCSLWCFFRSLRSTNNRGVRLHWHILQNKGTWNHSNYIKQKFSWLFQKL